MNLKFIVILLGIALFLNGCQANISDNKKVKNQSLEDVSNQIDQLHKDLSELNSNQKSVELPENVMKDMEKLEKDSAELEKKIKQMQQENSNLE